MDRLFRTILLWTLALALPMQGWAAATQLPCTTAIEEQPQHAAADTPHAHHDMHVAHHESTHDLPDMHDHGQEAPAKNIGKHADAKCSICASCCVGMAVLSFDTDWLLPPAGSMPVLTIPVASFLGHIPDGLKRPPRTVLA